MKMKNQSYPQSWAKFHEMVSSTPANQLQPGGLSALARIAGCTTRLPVVYRQLGWVKTMGDFWYYNGGDMLPSHWQALVRAKMQELVGKEKQRTPAHDAATALLDEIETHKVRSADAWIATDEELVHELRRRGYEVTARKIVEL